MNNNHIKGILTELKRVKEEDAEAICLLRNNPINNIYLSSSTVISVQDQIEWIRLNNTKNDGIYFKITETSTDQTVGTISLYNIYEKDAEFGRYICEKKIQAIESEYLILKYGFDVMGLNRIFCSTIEKNQHVWKQHYKFGFNDVGTGLYLKNNIRFRVQEIDKKMYNNFDYQSIITLLNKFSNR